MADAARYFPQVLKDIVEFKNLAKAENTAFTKAEQAIEVFQNNQFISEANEAGLKRWEQLLNIKTDTSLSITDRQLRLLTKLNNRLPYSFRWLLQKLDTVFGNENYRVQLINGQYRLIIKLDMGKASVSAEIYNDIRSSIPANLELQWRCFFDAEFAFSYTAGRYVFAYHLTVRPKEKEK